LKSHDFIFFGILVTIYHRNKLRSLQKNWSENPAVGEMHFPKGKKSKIQQMGAKMGQKPTPSLPGFGTSNIN